MGIFDSILGQVSEHSDVANLAAKLNIDPATTEKAIAALGLAHQQQGDTAQLAAEKTGLGVGTIQSIIDQIGGEGSLAEFANVIRQDPSKITAFFDKDGDGSVIDDITDTVRSLFGKS